MLEEINDPIQVAVIFKLGQTMPIKFNWRGRDYLISKVNLVYSQMDGRVKIYYFAVSDGVNYFKLQFNTDDLGWRLVELANG